MKISNSLKRAPLAGALFYLAGLLIPSLLQAQVCELDKADEQVQIRHIHDGDTLLLADGRKLRIIGVNTPELARDNKPAEPLAKQARDGLRRLIGDNARLQLRYGQEKNDRYDRLLAHVFLPDGQNISQWLLARGLAYSLTVPPNTWQSGCYQKAERKARRQKKGLWSKQYTGVLHADSLSNSLRGFQIIQGRINRIGHSKKTVWLNFNRQFAVRILRKDLKWFQSMDFEKLKGKQLEVRGWVQYHKRQLRMRIKHPSAMQISP